MHAPCVSVVVPTFNASAYVEGTLTSVLDQSLHALEAVVVDDGSTDDTLARVQRMAERDSRIRVFANDRNRGPSYTRNVAIDAARGEWIAVLDADDCMHRDRLETLVRTAADNGLDILADDVLFVHAHGSHAVDRLLPPSLFSAGAIHHLDPVSFLRMNPPGGNRGIGLIKPIIRAKVLRTSGVRYREELRLAEDLFLYLELILAGAKAAVFARGMYEYLVRPESLSRSRTETDIMLMINSYDVILDSNSPVQDPAVAELLRAHRDEMRSYSLPRYRLVKALQQRQLLAGIRVLMSHPLLPLEMLRRQQRE